MMEINKILLAGKKIIKGLLVSSIVLASAQADFLMTLTDKDGVEENLCVKSYSFSNNLESLAKQKGVVQDVYSEEEVLTNKIYLGKPVYRKIIKLDNVYGKVLGTFPEIDILVYDKINIRYKTNGSNTFSGYGGHNYYLDIRFNKATSVLDIYSTFKKEWDYIGEAIIEYTKTTDVVNTTPNTFKSYIHYIPSSSTTNELVSKDLENKGVIFDKNYTYDDSTDSCTKN